MNKTEIFKDYISFKQREDKDVNGVSPKFAEANPDYESQNKTNKGCWNCSNCSNCYGCSNCYYCYGCWNCSNCSNCYGCYGCYYCYDVKENKGKHLPDIPKIENIHQEVFKASSQEDSLNMDSWHTCEKTHCRAGWVVHLAGKEGRELEKKTSTAFAAMQIYKASSSIPVHPREFFKSNEEALADMERCAKEETLLNASL